MLAYSYSKRRCAPLSAGIMLAALSFPCWADDTPQAPQPDYTLTANVSLTSEYRYRGLMQSDGYPAVQGGVDFTHKSGFYLGNWDSSISWLSDGNSQITAPLEMDFYGGYRHNITSDLSYDVGALRYQYPGSYPSGVVSPNTTELYGALNYKFLTFKYSHAISDLFGTANSQHSQYFDLSANYDTGVWGLTVNSHVGYQYVRNLDDGSYWDWKLGLTKDFGQGWTASLAYLDTNANRSVYTNAKGRYMGRATGVLMVTKTF